MSYGSDNFDNDPNNFGSQGGRRSDTQNTDPNTNTTFSDSDLGGQGYGSGQQRRSDQPTSDQSVSGPGSGDWSTGGRSGQRDSGDTTDMNAPGAGGDFGDSGMQAGSQRGMRSGAGTGTGASSWDKDNSSGAGTGPGTGGRDWDTSDTSDTYGSGQDRSGGKPSMGDRVKGNVQKMAGRVSGNQGMVERGQERKTGDTGFDNDTGATNY